MESLKMKMFTKSQAIARKMVEKDALGWPPPCMGFIYQSVRPKTAPVFEDKDTSKNTNK